MVVLILIEKECVRISVYFLPFYLFFFGGMIKVNLFVCLFLVISFNPHQHYCPSHPVDPDVKGRKVDQAGERGGN